MHPTPTKIAGIASLIESLLYVIGFTFLLAVLEPLMVGTQNSQEQLAALLKYKVLYQTWILLIYVLFGVVLVVLILALDTYLAQSDSLILQSARVFGFIWAGLVLASGMVTNMGLDRVATLFPKKPEEAEQLWSTVLILQDGLGGGVEIVGGLWILGTSWLGMRSRKLPVLLNIMGIITGLSGILTVIPGLDFLQIIFGLVQLLWFAYLGVYLLLGAHQ